MKMTTYTETMTRQTATHQDWDAVKQWAKARIREAALCTATVALAGGLVFSLHKAMEHYVIMGF